MPRVTARHFRLSIEGFFEDRDCDVVCRKTRNGYALYRADNMKPMARLRPTGHDDEVEVFRWDGDRWGSIGEFGLSMNLPQALDYIYDDPEGFLFASGDGVSRLIRSAVRLFHQHVLFSAIVGGMVGGALAGPLRGAGAGAVASVLSSIALGQFPRGDRKAFLPSVFVAAPALLAAGTGGVLGGSVVALQPGSAWAIICGIVVGGLASLMSLVHRHVLWCIGFLAGLALAHRLLEWTELQEGFLALAIAALSASLYARVYSWLLGWYTRIVTSTLLDHEDGAASCRRRSPDSECTATCAAGNGAD